MPIKTPTETNSRQFRCYLDLLFDHRLTQFGLNLYFSSHMMAASDGIKSTNYDEGAVEALTTRCYSPCDHHRQARPSRHNH